MRELKEQAAHFASSQISKSSQPAFSMPPSSENQTRSELYMPQISSKSLRSDGISLTDQQKNRQKSCGISHRSILPDQLYSHRSPRWYRINMCPPPDPPSKILQTHLHNQHTTIPFSKTLLHFQDGLYVQQTIIFH